MILNWSRPVSPDVHNFDHSAFPGSGTASPRRSDDVTLFTKRGLCPLSSPPGEDAICF